MVWIYGMYFCMCSFVVRHGTWGIFFLSWISFVPMYSYEEVWCREIFDWDILVLHLQWCSHTLKPEKTYGHLRSCMSFIHSWISRLFAEVSSNSNLVFLVIPYLDARWYEDMVCISVEWGFYIFFLCIFLVVFIIARPLCEPSFFK